ncbi:MAG: hypothetical protein ACRDJ5_00500, partial [Actinomycetota bacterium]
VKWRIAILSGVRTRRTDYREEEPVTTMTIGQLLEAGLPDMVHAPVPVQWSCQWLPPLQDFEASGGNFYDYQEDLVLSTSGLSR